MSKTAARREAKLRTECAARYPTLPVRMWTSAASLAELVASDTVPPADEVKARRILQETDFEFRGGSRRWLAGWIARTRVGEVALN